MKRNIPILSLTRYFALLAALSFGGVLNVHAVSRSWSGAVTTANSGVWANNNNWNGASFPVAGDTAIFYSVGGANSGQVRITSACAAGLVIFTSTAVAFNLKQEGSGTLTIGTVQQDCLNNVQTIGANLAGSSGLTKTGNGVLLITGNNAYSGTLTVSAGKLLCRQGGGLAGSINVTSASATNGVQITSSGGQYTITNNLTYSSAGYLTFEFNNGIAPHSTTPPLQVNGNLAFTATPSVIVLNNSIPLTTASYPLIGYTGTASGTPPTSVTISPALSGGATANLSLDTENKLLKLNISTASTPAKLAYASVPTAGQQGLAFSVTVQSQDADSNLANVTSATTVTLSVASGSGSLGGTISGVIPNGENSVTISGVIYSAADTMTLTATPTAGMTGLTPVTSGNIAFTAEPTKLAYTSVPTAGTVGVPFSVTVQAQDAGGTPKGVTNSTTITLTKASGSGTLGGTTTGVITTGNTNVTISGVTYDTMDTMTVTASATAGMSLTAVTSGNIAFTPTAQTLYWGASDANWTDANVWTNVNLGAPATYNDVAPDSVVLEDAHSGAGDRVITLSSTVSPGDVTVDASKNFTITGSGTIAGSTGLSKDGAGTLTLGTANTFSGDTRIVAGSLVLANSGALAGSTLDMDETDAGMLAFASSLGTANIGNLQGSRSITLTDTGSGGVTLSIGANNANSTYTGALSGAGGFTKTGTGTLIWGTASSPMQTYTGDTTLSQGTVVVASDIFPHGNGYSGSVILNGTLFWNGSVTNTVNRLSGSGTTQAAPGSAAGLTIGDNDESSTFDGLLTRGNGSTLAVTKIGTGTLRLNNSVTANNVPVTVNGGKLIAGHPQALSAGFATVNAATLEVANQVLSSTLNLTLNNGATLVASGGADSAYGAANRQASIGAGASVTVATDTSGDVFTFLSHIKDGSATSLITAAGPGTIILTSGSASGYAGKWRLTGGTLLLGNANSLGATASRAIELAGGTLVFTNAADTTYSAATTISANSTMTANQPNVGVNHSFGTLSINDSILNVSPGNQLTGGTETNSFTTTTLTGNATFNVANNGARGMKLVLGAVGQSGGTRSLLKTGSGQLSITGDSTHTGDTTVSDGTLALTGSGSIGGSAAITVATGATLDASGRSDGTLTLGAGQTLSGTGTIVGALAVNGTVSPGSSIGTLNTGNQTWNSGGAYDWEVSHVSGTPGADWDLLNITGDLDVQATSGNPFTIKVRPTVDGGSITGIDKDTSASWTIATVSGSVLNLSADKFAVDDLAVTNDLGGGWFFVEPGSVKLTFTNNHAPAAYATNYNRTRNTALKIRIDDLIATRTSDPDGHARFLHHLRSGANVNESANGYTLLTNASFIFYTNVATHATDYIDYVVSDLANYRAGDTRRYATNTITINVVESTSSLTFTNTGGGELVLGYHGIPGYQYVLQRSCVDLASWQDLQTNTAPTEGGTIGQILFTNTPPEGCLPAFFRVRSE